MTTTPNTGVSLIDAAQAQKHVTVNEALYAFDVLAQLTVISLTETSPPSTNTEGDTYIVASGGTSGWTSQDNNVASYVNGSWVFYEPKAGWVASVAGETLYMYGSGGTWEEITSSGTGTASGIESPTGAATRLGLKEQQLTMNGASVTTSVSFPSRTIIQGVSARVLEDITGATSYSVGLASGEDQFGGLLSVGAGTANIGAVGPFAVYADTPVVVTATGGNFTGGTIQLSLHYIEMDAAGTAAIVTVPEQVVGVVVTAGDSSNTVTWTAPDDGGSVITDYIIERDSGSGYSVIADGTNTNLSYSDSGLVNGISYTYRVSAVNSIGTGTVSAVVTGTPAAAGTPVPTTISITEQSLPVYDSDIYGIGLASIPVSGTITASGTGAELQYRVINSSTSAVIVDWTNFIADDASTWSVTTTHAPSLAGMLVEVRAQHNTSITATHAQEFYSGHIVGWMGQSLLARPLVHAVATTLTPPAKKLWVLFNDQNGTLINGPIESSDSSVLGIRRMASVINAYFSAPVLIIDMTESGTGRGAMFEDADTDRAWTTTAQNPVDYVRTRGSDLCVVMDHWFTNDAATNAEFERHWAPGYLRLQVGGIGDTDNSTGITDYTTGLVEPLPSLSYTPDHYLWDLSSAGDSGLFESARTKWFPMFGAAHWNSGAHTDGQIYTNDSQKGAIRKALEQLTTATSFDPITLSTVSGYSGQEGFAGLLAQPAETHVAPSDADGEPLAGVYQMTAMGRALGYLTRSEPRIIAASFATSGAYVDVTVSLPHGGNLSTALIEHTAGAYAGSFEADNWVTPTQSTGDISELHDVQGFTIISGGVRTFTGFTAVIQDPSAGIIRITPAVAFSDGDQISFGYADGVHLLNSTDVASSRVHTHWPIETRTHVSGTGYGYPVVRESGDSILYTASGITAGGVTAPEQVGGLSVTAGDTENVLAWVTPADGGDAITDYIVEVNSGGGFAVVTDGTNTNTTYTHTGLTNGTTYTYRVSAVNSTGTGTASITAAGTPTTGNTAPSQVTGLGVVAGNAENTLTWTAPSNGGSVITDYFIEVDSGGGFSTLSDGTNTNTTYTHTGLTNGTTYTYRVAAVNAVGTGATSSTSTGTPAAVGPGNFDIGTTPIYFVDVANVPAGTTKIRYQVRLSMPTAPASNAYFFSQESTGADLRVLSNGKLRMTAEDSTGAKMMTSGEGEINIVPTTGVFHTYDVTYDHVANEATFIYDSGTPSVVPFSTTSSGTMQSNREISFLASTAGANTLPVGTTVEYLRVYLNDVLHKEINQNAAAANADAWKLGGDAV